MTPCTCKYLVRRDPETFGSTTRVIVDGNCPRHGLPKPKEKK